MKSLFKFKTFRFLILSIFASTIVAADALHMSVAYASVSGLPAPGTMVQMTNDYSLPILKGLKINPDKPFDLNFIVDANDQGKISKEEANKLISYFMAALTIDKENIWVNLSPYEQERITDPNLAITDLGKDLLKQDYMLKQLSASLTHPETKTGQNYWGTENANSDLSKIWIVPQETNVYQKDNSVYVTKMTFDVKTQSEQNVSSSLAGILDEVRAEVNNGETFANLRQIFHSIALAQWFKVKLQDSIFKHYINQNKVAGIDIDDKTAKDKIWAQYVESFNKGAYNTVAKVKDNYTGRVQKQKYFCGGVNSSSIVLTDVEKGGVRLTEDVYSLMMTLTDENGNYWGDKALETENTQAIPTTEEIIDELMYSKVERTNLQTLTRAIGQETLDYLNANQIALYNDLISIQNPLLFEFLVAEMQRLDIHTSNVDNHIEHLTKTVDILYTTKQSQIDLDKAETAFLIYRNKRIIDEHLSSKLIKFIMDNNEQAMQDLMFERNSTLVQSIAEELKLLYGDESNLYARESNAYLNDLTAVADEFITQSLENDTVVSTSLTSFYESLKKESIVTLADSNATLPEFIKALKLAFDQGEFETEARRILAKDMPRTAEVSRVIDNYMLLEEIPDHAAYYILHNKIEYVTKWLSVKNPAFLRMLATEYVMIHKMDIMTAINAFDKALDVVDTSDYGYVKAMKIVSDASSEFIKNQVRTRNVTEHDIHVIKTIGIELTKQEQTIVIEIEKKLKLAKEADKIAEAKQEQELQASNDEIKSTMSSNVEVEEFDPFGGIDAQALDIKAEAMSSSIEFKNFDPVNFNGFGFVVSKLERTDRETLLAAL